MEKKKLCKQNEMKQFDYRKKWAIYGRRATINLSKTTKDHERQMNDFLKDEKYKKDEKKEE